MQRKARVALISSLMLVFSTTLMVEAATIRVRCEQRGVRRAIISVDGKDLARGEYMALVMSGGNIAASELQPSVGDEVEVDFASNRNDITAGATPVARDFIQDGQVTGKIVNALGYTVITDTVNCRRRN